MKLKLSTQTIQLPDELNTEERLAFVNKILEENPLEFQYGKKMFGLKYGIRQDNNKLVKIKLDILATYLIRSDKDYTKGENQVMSRYKEVKRPMQETSFSQFDKDVQDINGWH